MDFRDFREFFHHILPRSIRHSNNPEDRIRGRVLAGLYASNLAIGGFIILLYLGAIIFGGYNLRNEMLGTLALIGLLGLQIALFYRLADVGISAVIFSMLYFLITLSATFATGGWHSPAIMMLFCAPVISFLVGGRAEGFYITLLTGFCGLVLMVTHQMAILQFQVIAPENIEIVRAGIWITSITLLACCLAVYDSLLERATFTNEALRTTQELDALKVNNDAHLKTV